MRTGTARGLAVAAVLLALHGCAAEREPAGGASATPSATPTSVATLTLTGSPTCRSETPSCADPDESWTARFTVP
jgi:hypothetical protein